MVVPLDASKDKNVTFLALPPDAQKLARRPNTNVMSDKDRTCDVAASGMDECAAKLCNAAAGRPGDARPAEPQAAQAPPQAMAQNQPSAQQQPQQSVQRPQFQSDQNQNALMQTTRASEYGERLQQICGRHERGFGDPAGYGSGRGAARRWRAATKATSAWSAALTDGSLETWKF